MRRLSVGAFVALAIATVAAFFVTQHLKVTTPLIAGFPAPVPSTINPVSGGTCRIAMPPRSRLVRVSFKRTRVSFYLLNRADNVEVYIVNQDGTVVRTLHGSGAYMRVKRRRTFVWNGRADDGRVVPDGPYDIQVSLVHQGRTLLISNQNSGAVEPVTVQTHPPALRVTAVTPDVIASPGSSSVKIRYSGNDGLRPRVVIFRAGAAGAAAGARPVKSYAATTLAGTSVWNGTLTGGRPAPAGTYLVALRLLPDRTCNDVQSPLSAAAAPHALVTVR